MDSKKRQNESTSPTKSNKKQELENKNVIEINLNNKESNNNLLDVKISDDKISDNKSSDDNLSDNNPSDDKISDDNLLDDNLSDDNSNKKEINYCYSCNTEIKMESQICGRCAREMSYF